MEPRNRHGALKNQESVPRAPRRLLLASTSLRTHTLNGATEPGADEYGRRVGVSSVPFSSFGFLFFSFSPFFTSGRE